MIIMMELAGKGRACIPVGPKMVYLTEQNVFEKKKKSLTGPGQHQTCSHLIYARHINRYKYCLSFYAKCKHIGDGDAKILNAYTIMYICFICTLYSVCLTSILFNAIIMTI